MPTKSVVHIGSTARQAREPRVFSRVINPRSEYVSASYCTRWRSGLAPHLGAFGAVAAHLNLVAALEQRLAEALVLVAVPERAKGLVLSVA